MEKCIHCGSDNLKIFQDGSGICQYCKKAFLHVKDQKVKPKPLPSTGQTIFQGGQAQNQYSPQYSDQQSSTPKPKAPNKGKCPKCSEDLIFIDARDQWYCYACKTYLKLRQSQAPAQRSAPQQAQQPVYQQPQHQQPLYQPQDQQQVYPQPAYQQPLEQQQPNSKFCPICGVYNHISHNFCVQCHNALPQL